jgi:hypothetical protein
VTKIPFTVYDIFAYVFSGGVVVTAIDYAFGYQWILNVEKSALLAIFIIFLAYVSGHLIAHFSSFFLRKERCPGFRDLPIQILPSLVGIVPIPGPRYSVADQ